jgi:hypothetical protein
MRPEGAMPAKPSNALLPIENSNSLLITAAIDTRCRIHIPDFVLLGKIKP